MDKQKVYRAAIIGCGFIGSEGEERLRGAPARFPLPFGHPQAMKALPRLALVAGVDVDPQRLAAFGRRWGVTGLYRSHEEMLASERPEVVVVASPTPLHARHAIDCARAGVRGIFLEKPVATNLRDLEEVERACAQQGTRVTVNHFRHGDAYYRQMKWLIAEGAIGRLHSFVAFGRGQLMYQGSHAFDMLNWVAESEVDWVVGHLDDDASALDPGGDAYVRYKNGLRGFVHWASGGPLLFRLHILGSEGEIVIGNYDLELWRANRESPRRELLLHPFPQVMQVRGAMEVILEDLLDRMEDGGETLCSLADGRRATEIILALHDSARQGNSRVVFPYRNYDLDVPCL